MQRWGVLEEVWNDASRDYADYNKASIKNYRVYKRLGVIVVALTAVVGTSVFNNIVDGQQNIYVKYATAVISVLSTVLSAVQAFADYGAASRKQYEFSIECYAVLRSIDIFFQTYPTYPRAPDQRAACDAAQSSIVERYAKAKPGGLGGPAAA